MKRIIGTLTLVLGISSAVVAQEPIKYIEYDLPNGLHVILHEDHDNPLTVVSVMYHVGSQNESPKRTGFAHFFEHLMFEGSENIGRGEYAKLVEKNGGMLNANTTPDRTYYYEMLPSNQTELGIWMEAERMLHAKVDSVGIETQRNVVKEERRMRFDNQPYGTFIEEAFQNTFKGTQYGWSVIGSMADLTEASEDDYVNFYQTYYVPANATLSIAGDINVQQTKQWIDKYFKSIPTGQAINLYRNYLRMDNDRFKKTYNVDKSIFDSKDFFASKNATAKKMIADYSKQPTIINRPEKNDGNLPKSITKTVYDNIELPALFMIYKLPNENHPDAYAIQLMNSVLAGSESARIPKQLVEKKELSTAAFSFPYMLENAGMDIIASINAKGITVDQTQKAIEEEIKKMQDNLISGEELEKVKNQTEKDYINRLANIASIAEILAQSHVYQGSTELANTELQRYMKVSKDDIQRVAKNYLTDNNRVILYYLPKPKEEK